MIDASADLIADYRAMLDEYDLTLRLLLVTSAGTLHDPDLLNLCTASGAMLLNPNNSGEQVYLGEDSIRTIACPPRGHCYAWHDRVFTGDLLASIDHAFNAATANKLLQLLTADTLICTAKRTFAQELPLLGTCAAALASTTERRDTGMGIKQSQHR